MDQKRLYKARGHRMVCGVCGGIAEYFGVDPTIVRLAFVLLCFGWGSGLLAYPQELPTGLMTRLLGGLLLLALLLRRRPSGDN